MVSAVQYGGAIIDILDVRLLMIYTEKYLTDKSCYSNESISFSGDSTPAECFFKSSVYTEINSSSYQCSSLLNIITVPFKYSNQTQ